MQLEIIDRLSHERGVIYKIKIFDKITEILYLSHVIERIKKWGITEEMVAETYEDKIFKGS